MADGLARFFKTLALVVCLSLPSLAQVYSGIALQKTSGNWTQVVPLASVTVCTAGGTGNPCTPKATLYTDYTLATTTTNPLIADVYGNYTIYAQPGVYYVCVAGSTSFCQYISINAAANNALADPGANGIVKRTSLNTTAIATSTDVIGLWTGTCNSTSFLRGDGACATGVTSIGLTVNSTSPSGIFTVTGSPVTGSGTLNFNLSGTSGGVPYFSSSTVLSSTGTLTNHGVVIGQGSGSAPVATAAGASNTALIGQGASGDPIFSTISNATLQNSSITLNGPGGIFSGFGAVSLGGTLNITTSGTSGGVPYFSAATTISSSGALTQNTLVLGGGAGGAPTSLGAGTTTTLLHGNAAGAPTFSAVSLTADVSGTLPIANGGTGQTTASTAFNALSPMTTAGDVIYGGTAGAGTRLAVGTSTQVLHSGTTPSWAAVTLTTDVTGILPVANGGTGLASGTSGGILGYTASGTLASSAALTANALVLGGGAGATPTALGSLGTTTTLLHGNAAGAPTFGAVVNGDITNGTIDLTTKVANAAASTIFGNPTGGSAAPTFTTAPSISGQFTSSLATGTAPFSIASTTPVANLTTVPTTYNHSGTQQTATHLVQDSCTLGTDCAVTLTGSAVYTSSTSYTCVCEDDTAIAACKVAQTSGSAFTITGTGTDAIRYICVGN